MSRSLTLLIAALLAVPAPAHAGVLDEPATLTCDGRVTFAQSAFRNPTGAENGADPAAQALREYLVAQPYRTLPRTGWRELARTDAIVVFHHGRPDSGVAVTMARVDDGWRPAGGGCTARRVVPGLTVAPARVARGPLTRDARTISVALFGGGCDRDPVGRVRRIEVRETRHTVTLLVLVRPAEPIPPGVSCPADQIVAFKKVRLRRPLGRRAIRDARTFPARVAGRAK